MRSEGKKGKGRKARKRREIRAASLRKKARSEWIVEEIEAKGLRRGERDRVNNNRRRKVGVSSDPVWISSYQPNSSAGLWRSLNTEISTGGGHVESRADWLKKGRIWEGCRVRTGCGLSLGLQRQTAINTSIDPTDSLLLSRMRPLNIKPFFPLDRSSPSSIVSFFLSSTYRKITFEICRWPQLYKLLDRTLLQWNFISKNLFEDMYLHVIIIIFYLTDSESIDNEFYSSTKYSMYDAFKIVIVRKSVWKRIKIIFWEKCIWNFYLTEY